MSTATTIALPERSRTRQRNAWLAPTGLMILSLVPVIAGAARLTELTSGADVTPANSRFLESPIPVVIHIVAATVFSLLGAIQFVPSLRRGKRRWHRLAGRILVPAGLLTALSALWMALFYSHPAGDGPLLTAFRLIFGSAMVVSLVLGFMAVRRRDFVRHSEWMTRAYAIALGAGTQVVLLIPAMLVWGATHELSRAVFSAVAWLLNLAIAEYVIRRRRQPVGVRSISIGAGR